MFNLKNDLVNEDGTPKNYISEQIFDTLKQDAKTGTRSKIIGGIFIVVD